MPDSICRGLLSADGRFLPARSRRAFLAGCCLALPGLAFASAGVFGTSVARASKGLAADLSFASLASLVSTNFRVLLSPGGTVDLELIKARLALPYATVSGRRPPADAANERFALVFCGSGTRLLSSGIHQMEHSQLGQFAISIERVGPFEPERAHYEAVFNRPIPGCAAPTVII